MFRSSSSYLLICPSCRSQVFLSGWLCWSWSVSWRRCSVQLQKVTYWTMNSSVDQLSMESYHGYYSISMAALLCWGCTMSIPKKVAGWSWYCTGGLSGGFRRLKAVAYFSMESLEEPFCRFSWAQSRSSWFSERLYRLLLACSSFGCPSSTD